MPAAGWSKPLKVRYMMKLPELMSAIRKYTPVGKHEHDQISGTYFAPGFPRTGGRLLREVSKLANYRAPKGANRVEVTIDLPYARMIDRGGNVKRVSGKRMVWRQGGQDIQKRSRRGYNIKGADYMGQGMREWVGTGPRGGKHGIKPEWV